MKNKIGSSKSMKKMQKGGSTPTPMKPPMSMKDLKKKYPDVDTSKAGDVRGTEINAYAPKKVLDKYNDTYNAFDKKFKNGPSYKKGGSVKKYQAGGETEDKISSMVAARAAAIAKPLSKAAPVVPAKKSTSDTSMSSRVPEKAGTTPPKKIMGTTPPMKKGGSVGSSKKPKMAKGGSVSFGMLSVKKGIDNNPKPTAADRIAGAKMKKGGMVKKSSKKK